MDLKVVPHIKEPLLHFLTEIYLMSAYLARKFHAGASS